MFNYLQSRVYSECIISGGDKENVLSLKLHVAMPEERDVVQICLKLLVFGQVQYIFNGQKDFTLYKTHHVTIIDTYYKLKYIQMH